MRLIITKQELHILADIVEGKRYMMARSGFAGSVEYDYSKTPKLNRLLDKLRKKLK